MKMFALIKSNSMKSQLSPTDAKIISEIKHSTHSVKSLLNVPSAYSAEQDLSDDTVFVLNSDDDNALITSEQLSNLALIVAYSLIVIVSLFGNIFVCRVMMGLTRSRTTTNVLIFNLAVSDLLLTTFNIPINIVRFVSRDWPLGSIICTLTPFIQSLSAHCCSITMMVIAFERYRRYAITVLKHSVLSKPTLTLVQTLISLELLLSLNKCPQDLLKVSDLCQ